MKTEIIKSVPEISSLQSLSRVSLFATQWTVASFHSSALSAWSAPSDFFVSSQRPPLTA